MILQTPAQIDTLLANTKRIAVLGIKTEEQATQPAFSVAAYAQRVGFDIVPVPVYFPDVNEILGEKVFRKLTDIPGDIDLVDVFRRPADIDQHVEDIIAKKPRAVWFQLGIRNDDAAKRLSDAGIDVVQDKCLLIEHRRFASSATSPRA